MYMGDGCRWPPPSCPRSPLEDSLGCPPDLPRLHRLLQRTKLYQRIQLCPRDLPLHPRRLRRIKLYPRENQRTRWCPSHSRRHLRSQMPLEPCEFGVVEELRPLDLPSHLELSVDPHTMMCTCLLGEDRVWTFGLSAQCVQRQRVTQPWCAHSVEPDLPVADAL